MVTIAIDHQQVVVDEQSTILEVAKGAYIETPHLCYLRDINETDACRVCVVELQGKDKLVAACSTIVQEGTAIYTSSPEIRYARRYNVELLLSQRDYECVYCSRSGNCSLQKISNDLGTTSLPYEKKVVYILWNQNFLSIRESSKCTKCIRCIQICDKIQNLQVWDMQNTGSRTTVNVSLNRSIEEVECSLCGQCITHCPVNALCVREDSERAFVAFNDPDKITIVQIAPAVCAVREKSLGLRREEVTAEKLGDAFRRMDADYVFDADFAADLTIMEEAGELLGRLHRNKEQEMPMFTSYCPGWVRFLKSQYPDMVSRLSISKSPHQILGVVTRTRFAEEPGVGPSSTYNISVVPYVAKKHEANIPVMNNSGYRDVDVVLITREVVRMIRAEYIGVDYLQDHPLDDLLGTASEASVVFGATGGVIEAVLRSAYYFVTSENTDTDAPADVRGMGGWKESTSEIQGIPVCCAIVSGLGNTRRLIEAMHRKEVAYDFIKVVAYPGGCNDGGRQLTHDGEEFAAERADTLYHLDRNAELRYSYESPSIYALRDEYLGKSLSELVEKLLHTGHEAWQIPYTEC